MGGIATATEREAQLEAEREARRALPAPTAVELRDLAKRLRVIAKAIFQSGKLDIPFVKNEFATIFSPLVVGWYTRAIGWDDEEQKRLFEAVASLVKLRSGVAVDSPVERLTSIADDCDALATTLYPQPVTVTPQPVKPSDKEIALAREACLVNPKILRADLMTKLEIGSDKASMLLDLMRDEGIHKTRKRKSPSKNG